MIIDVALRLLYLIFGHGPRQPGRAVPVPDPRPGQQVHRLRCGLRRHGHPHHPHPDPSTPGKRDPGTFHRHAPQGVARSPPDRRTASSRPRAAGVRRALQHPPPRRARPNERRSSSTRSISASTATSIPPGPSCCAVSAATTKPGRRSSAPCGWPPPTWSVGSSSAGCRSFERVGGRRAGLVGARGWPPRNVAGCRLRAGADAAIGEVGAC
jgi:hypothetical protein